MAWLSGNPFNGSVFAMLAAALAWLAPRISNSPVRLAGRGWVVFGVAVIMFGWTYPHFLRARSWVDHLFASPLGLLPCPTLSGVIGMTMLFRDFRSNPWNAMLVVVGLFYGAVGVFRLGVVLDWGLLFPSALLGFALARDYAAPRSVRATRSERSRPLPGDELIHEPLATLTHAITINRSPQAVWPWLVQMGAGSRAGWYSYDLLDNAGQPSATRLMPELQDIAIGTLFPALPGATDGFTVLGFTPFRSLILGWPDSENEPLVTWAFILEQRSGDTTRLIARARGGRAYRFHGLPSWLSKPIARVLHFVMQREQLLGIARRVESSNLTVQRTALL
jgi:hypothetical protein